MVSSRSSLARKDRTRAVNANVGVCHVAGLSDDTIGDLEGVWNDDGRRTGCSLSEFFEANGSSADSIQETMAHVLVEPIARLAVEGA